MRKLLGLTALAIMLVFTFSTNVFASDDLTVKVNGETIEFTDAKPFINEVGRTMIPIRFVSEALGAEVDWDGNTKTATIVLKKRFDTYTSKVTIGSKAMDYEIYNSENADLSKKEIVQMDTTPIIYNDRTYVPLRAISEALYSHVDWDGSTRTVIIIEKETAMYHHLFEDEVIKTVKYTNDILEITFPQLPDGYSYSARWEYTDLLGNFVQERIDFSKLTNDTFKADTINVQQGGFSMFVRNPKGGGFGGTWILFPSLDVRRGDEIVGHVTDFKKR